ncbi:putative spermidine/putrescine transport system ATP-binding protein [Stella humosa]|uniref:Spermidine/putrescine import ATP-binding protein PotA n=1 Tax=Stella humosa TaxID=94 RepID=A0A3N1MLW1_9PROT|nr:ABC transporter ATP-binding protein [Stella humosa]ROQ01986.1 putative spermidine/putrescine transport system ATP-binding protein [Stella humosa]BBK32375.1 polyamine-transporting ATPase [Stella humosa]
MTVSRTAPTVTIREVTKTYGKFRALDAVSLDIAAGEFVTLLGPSGSGKTTLLMVLAGFVRPDSGSIRFGDVEMILKPPHQRDIGIVFQNYALFPHMNVAGNVGYPLRLRGVAKADIARRVEAALALVQLQGYGERRVDQLSGGQKQRVALARAVVFEPRILLMDEPLSALDKKLREQMQIEIRQLHERLGITTVYVTHDQREALTMSDRIAVIDQGRFAQIDTPSRLYERPANRFVADFVGESHFLPVTVSGGGARLDERALVLAGPPGVSDGPALLVVRPEKLDILDQASVGGVNRIDGVVEGSVYQGESFLLQVRVAGGQRITLRQPTRREALSRLPRTGEPIALGLHPEDTILVGVEAAR